MVKFNNKNILPGLQFVAFAAIYFNISFFFPWEDFSFNTISSSYFFDFIFWLGAALFLKEEPRLGEFQQKGALIRTSVTLLIAVIICSLSLAFDFNSPFRYLDSLAVKLLILAPFFEEIVFRGALYDLLKKVPDLQVKFQHIINALLFSLSHAAALFVLPEEFLSFIYYQLFYTFILGWLCSKSREMSKGLMEPIVLHFVFNLMFYTAIKNYGL